MVGIKGVVGFMGNLAQFAEDVLGISGGKVITMKKTEETGLDAVDP